MTELDKTTAELEKANAELAKNDTIHADAIKTMEHKLKELQKLMDHKIGNIDTLIDAFNRTSTCRKIECRTQISLNCYVTPRSLANPLLWLNMSFVVEDANADRSWVKL